MSSVMDGDVLSLSSCSSLPTPSSAAAAGSQQDASAKNDSSLPHSCGEHTSTKELWPENASSMGDRLLSTDEQVTLITESLTVTSTDQEKLLLLDKNTELRRVNKELMKLNEDWDQVFRSATLGLQRRLEALELENSAIKQLNSQLLLKVEQQQSSKEYYEQALMMELKKNQELQEYVRLLESRMHHSQKDISSMKQGTFSAGSFATSGHISRYSPSSSFLASPISEAGYKEKSSTITSMGTLGNSKQEVKDLKEQLEALRCQTEIYEADYQTEHNDHKHTLQENRRLRKKREEMRQQVVLLQEQLKIYEDDFRRERSDKQMLQRLLSQKTSQNKDAVLVHRCNNEQQLLVGETRGQSGEKRKQHHPLCPQTPQQGQGVHLKDQQGMKLWAYQGQMLTGS